MEIINLTPHPVHLVTDTGTVTIPSADLPLPRVATTQTPSGEVKVAGVSVPVVRVGLGELASLPDPQDGTVYIVSRMVADAAPDRHDLLIPHDLVRDEQGRVTGCRALARVA